MVGDRSHSTQSSNHETLTIMYSNARSLLPKIEELRVLVHSNQPDIICIVESWLSQDVFDNEINITGYNCHRKDRNRHGGGVCVYTSQHLVTMNMSEKVHADLECIFVNVLKGTVKTTVRCFYRPPNSPSYIFDTLTDSIFALQPNLLTNFALIGDFNVDTSRGINTCLNNFMATLSLNQVVSSTTHISPSGRETTIDLCFMSCIENLISCETRPPLGNSDHKSLVVTLRSGCMQRNKLHYEKLLWRYTEANVERACALIRNTDWKIILTSNVNESWQNWKRIFLEIMQQCVPQAKQQCRRRLPWINKSIMCAIKRRDHLYYK